MRKKSIMRKVAWSIIGTLICLGVMAALSPRFAQAEGTNASSSIDYVYIDSSNLSLGEEQRVAIGFSSAPESSPRSIVLTDGDGSNYEMSLTSNVGFDYLFSSDSLPAQQYTIAGVLCESGETLSLGEEVDAVFSVGAHDDSSVTAFDIDDGDGFETAFVGDDQSTASLVDFSGLEAAAGAGTLRFTIALDAGHGGWDSGAIGNGLQEKTLTLKIAQYCREELEQYEGVKVVMLRDSDASLTSNNSTREELQRRCDVAHENHANFYMSFHINSGGGAGAEVWIPTESTWYQTFHEEGASVGNKVLDRITALGLSNRGLKEGHYEVDGNKLYYPDGSEADSLAVIRYCREYGIPAVLVEHGFIDNPADAAKLSDGSFLRQLGAADARAIADRFGLSKVKKPAPVIADTDNGSVTLQWEETPGAAQYAVAIRNEDGSFKTYTYDCADTSYTVTGLTNGKTYQFLVQAKVDGKWTPYSELDLVECELVPQPRFTAEPAGDGEVQLNWGAIDGADAYAVAERLADGSYRTFTYSATGTSYKVTGLECGVEHRFLVQSRVAGRWSSFGEGTLVSCVPTGPSRPSVTAAAGDRSVTLSWPGVPGAQRYAVAWRRAGDSAWRTSTYTCAGESYTVSGLANGTSYEFVVQAWFGGRWSPFGSADIARAVPADPTVPRFTAEPAGDGEVQLNWGAIDGADAYAVAERLADGSYRTFTYSATGTSYKVTGLECGVEHRFLVQSRVAGRWSSFGEGTLVSCVPTGPSRPSVTAAAGDRSVTLSWPGVPGAQRYAVAWRRAGDSAWRTSTYTCAGESYTVSGLANGTSYEFVVQAWFGGRWSPFGSADIARATTAGTPIMGPAETTIDQMVSVYEASGAAYPSALYVQKGAPTIRSFCSIAYNEAVAEGVRPEVLFAQAMHETGWLRFGGDVKPEQCNFGGLGATGNGVSGLTFPDVATGLRAQVQHLKAYASTDPLKTQCVDPRFYYVTRGCAPCVEDLAGRWASDRNYGKSLVTIINRLI